MRLRSTEIVGGWQLFALAAHIPHLIAAGDPFQKLGNETGHDDCGTAVDWLEKNAEAHKLYETRRFGRKVLDLLKLDNKSGEFSDMIKAATSASENNIKHQSKQTKKLQ